jgi:hypothetical protein
MNGLPRSAELPAVMVPTFGASECFGKSIPFAAARQSRKPVRFSSLRLSQ